MNKPFIYPQNKEKWHWAIDGLEQGRAIFLRQISDQADLAERPCPTFASVHEAYGMLQGNVAAVLDIARQRENKRDLHQLRQELIQVAATAVKALESLEEFVTQ